MSSNQIEDWAARDRLPPDTVKVLLDQGFTSLDELRDLTPEDIAAFFQRTGLLPAAKCLALKKAIARLSNGDNAPPAQSPPQAACSSSGKYTGGKLENHFKFLLLGKTGSGKSTTGNTILGERKFCSDLTFASVTVVCDLQRGNRAGALIEIMDCPGLYDTSKTQDEIATVIVQAVACMHPGPDAVLYVVRLGRYTPEEYGAYRRLKALFDENITNYIIVIFTGGDALDQTSKTLADLMNNAPKELHQVLEECGNRSLIFNNNASNPTPQVEKLLDTARGLKRQNGDPYLCPKYKEIGEGLEEEVAKRLAVVDKKELEKQKYVQELEQKTKAAEEDVRKKKEEIEKKEQERQRQMKEEERKHQQEVELLRKQMEDQKLSEERRRQEERELQARLEGERLQHIQQLEEQRRQDKAEINRKEEESKKLKNKLEKEEREAQERRDRRHDEEMRCTQDRIARNQEPGFVERAASFIFDPVEKFCDTVKGWFS